MKKAKLFKLICVLVLLCLPLIIILGVYIHEYASAYSPRKPFLLFLSDKSEIIYNPNIIDNQNNLSAKSNIDGLCLEREYRRKYFYSWDYIFDFFIPETVVKDEFLKFEINNSTIHDFQLSMEKRSKGKWEHIDIPFSIELTQIDTTIKEATEWKKVEGSTKVYSEPELMILGKVITNKIVTSYRTEKAWDQKYHFLRYRFNVIIPTKELDYGRYRINASLNDTTKVWNEFDLVPKRDITWIFNDSLITNRDKISIGLSNNDNKAFYYCISQDHVCSGITAIVDDSQGNDSTFFLARPFTDDGSETYLTFPAKRYLHLEFLFPFDFIEYYEKNKGWNYSIYDQNNPEEFINKFTEIFGDSFEIQFIIPTRSLRTSKFQYQDLYSPKFRINTNTIFKVLSQQP
jgi:hypothetical protein